MDIRYLKTLVTVVETGSFSNQILFDRSAATTSLTAAGEIVLESARRIVGIADSLEGQLKKINGRQKVSLCCTPTFGTVYLSGVLNRFMLESGGTPADLNFLLHNPEPALEGVIKKEFDIAVVEHCPATDLSQFQTYSLPDDELVFVASPKLKLPSSNHDIESIFDFSIFVRGEGCSSRQLLTRGLADQGKSLDDFASVVTSDDLRLTRQSILSGGGISFMSKCLVCEYLETGQMIEHHVEGFPRSRQRKVVMEKGREEEKLLCDLARCIFRAMDVPSPI